MRQQLDPKEVIAKATAKANAEALIKKQMEESNPDISKVVRNHRGHCTLLMKDGSIKTGIIKIATFTFFAFEADHQSALIKKSERIMVEDVASIEI